MTLIRQKSRWQRLLVALPPIADGLTALAIVLLVPALSVQLAQPAALNALVLILFYILFCVGIYLSRKLLPQVSAADYPPPSWLMTPKVRGLLGLTTALLMTTTIAYQLGFFATIFQVSAGTLQEGQTAALFVYAPGAWLAFSMIVVLVSAFPVNETVTPAGGRYAGFALASLALTNSLLVLASGQLRAMFGLLGFSTVPAWMIAMLALVVTNGLARIIYQSRQPWLSGWASFSLLVLLAAATAAVV